MRVEGIRTPAPRADLPCGESGSTLRFFVPIAAALGVEASCYGEGNLPNRPITPLTDVLAEHGIQVSKQGQEMLTLTGRLTGGVYRLPGNISSQYITGLLFALPLLEEDSEIRLTTPLESKGYVEMTLEALERSGIRVDRAESGYRIPGRQRYRAWSGSAEGDYSNAAFWLAAGALGSDITLEGLSPASRQGDRMILELMKDFGASVSQAGLAVHIASGGRPKAMDIDLSDIPDLGPILAVTAAFSEGTSTLYNAGRLRIKECDRLAAVAESLNALGAAVEDHPDKLVIHGKGQLDGGCVVSGYNDHRMAMALTVAALGCREPVTIREAQCVAKSYPGFYEHFAALGGVSHVV